MCIGCPDFVDMCAQDECFDPEGGQYGKFRKFYLGDTYCRHLQEFYGHPIAESADYAIKYAYEHEDEAEA